MEIDSKNLVDINTINQKNFQSVNTQALNDERLKEVCDDFESFFINQIMNVSLKDTKVAGEGAGSDIIKSMYTQAIAENSAGSMGISTMLYEFLSENNTKK